MSAQFSTQGSSVAKHESHKLEVPGSIPGPAPIITAARFRFLLRWWCEVLVDAILRPAYVKWRDAERRSSINANLFYRDFLEVVDCTDCYPCRVEWGNNQSLCISAFSLEPVGYAYIGGDHDE